MDRRFAPHIHEIRNAAKGISDVDFSRSGMFTNSQIEPPPIVSLLRDTEQYERTLFSMPHPISNSTGKPSGASRRHTALGMVLGGDMMEQIRHLESKSSDNKGQVNVHVLLDGAEKLVKVYPMPGAVEKITYLRQRFNDLKDSIVLYEEIVAEQQIQLELQRENDFLVDEDNGYPLQIQSECITEDMIAKEEEAIRLLEARRDMLDLEIKRIDNTMSKVAMHAHRS